MARTAERVRPKPSPAPLPRKSQSLRRIALRVLADGIAIMTSLFLASTIRFEVLQESPNVNLNYTVVTLVATPIWLLLFWAYRLYEPRQVLSPVNEFKQVFHGVVGGTVVLLISDSVLRLNLARGWALLAMFCGFVVLGGERLAVRKSLHFLRRRGGDTTRTLVLGANHEGRTVANTLEREGWLGYEIVGFLDDDLPSGEKIDESHKVLAPVADVKKV